TLNRRGRVLTNVRQGFARSQAEAGGASESQWDGLPAVARASSARIWSAHKGRAMIALRVSEPPLILDGARRACGAMVG
ncbi:hypothetical protein ACDT17_18360, partial [Chromobacterium piscinae]|uniref:hypothetical protein n=1 Tax=Chromobacterium piscinae TaxID=686831 RepID=UPI003556E67F